MANEILINVGGLFCSQAGNLSEQSRNCCDLTFIQSDGHGSINSYILYQRQTLSLSKKKVKLNAKGFMQKKLAQIVLMLIMLIRKEDIKYTYIQEFYLCGT